MRCWEDTPRCYHCNPDYYDDNRMGGSSAPYVPYKEPKPKKPRKAAKHYCNRCRRLLPTKKVRWDKFVEAWECRSTKDCTKHILDGLPENFKRYLEFFNKGAKQ